MAFPEPAIEAKFWVLKRYFLDKLAKDNVEIYPHVQYREITPKGVALTTEEGKEIFLEADDIVLSTGSTPDDTLGKSLGGNILILLKSGIVSNPGKYVRLLRRGFGQPWHFKTNALVFSPHT